MASIWAGILGFIASILRASFAFFTAFKIGQAKGETDAELERTREDYDALARAAAARERASDDSDGVWRDPFDQDNKR